MLGGQLNLSLNPRVTTCLLNTCREARYKDLWISAASSVSRGYRRSCTERRLAVYVGLECSMLLALINIFSVWMLKQVWTSYRNVFNNTQLASDELRVWISNRVTLFISTTTVLYGSLSNRNCLICEHNYYPTETSKEQEKQLPFHRRLCSLLLFYTIIL